MAVEEKNSKSKVTIIRIIVALIIIIIALSVLSTMLSKFKKERQLQKSTEYRSESSNQYVKRQRESQNGAYDIGEIDIPDLFGTRVPIVTEERNRNIQNTEKNKNINKNTKEKTITERENSNNILPKPNKSVEELRKQTLNEKDKLLKKYNNQKIAKNIFVIKMIQRITFPILISIFILSYIYEIAFGLRAKKNWKHGLKIRIITIILLLITQVLPYTYFVIIKNWGN